MRVYLFDNESLHYKDTMLYNDDCFYLDKKLYLISISFDEKDYIVVKLSSTTVDFNPIIYCGIYGIGKKCVYMRKSHIVDRDGVGLYQGDIIQILDGNDIVSYYIYNNEPMCQNAIIKVVGNIFENKKLSDVLFSRDIKIDFDNIDNDNAIYCANGETCDVCIEYDKINDEDDDVVRKSVDIQNFLSDNLSLLPVSHGYIVNSMNDRILVNSKNFGENYGKSIIIKDDCLDLIRNTSSVSRFKVKNIHAIHIERDDSIISFNLNRNTDIEKLKNKLLSICGGYKYNNGDISYIYMPDCGREIKVDLHIPNNYDLFNCNYIKICFLNGNIEFFLDGELIKRKSIKECLNLDALLI